MLVYRCGDLHGTPLTGRGAERTRIVDAARPAGHLARAEAVFCAPSLAGVARWTYQRVNEAFWRTQEDGVSTEVPATYAVEIDPDGVMAYWVDRWEDVCRDHLSQSDLHPESYWSSATPIDAFPQDLAVQNWEVLVPRAAIISMTEVSLEEVCEAADPEHHVTSWLCALAADLACGKSRA